MIVEKLPKTLSLFVFIDALGYEILKNHSFLDDVLKTKAPLGTIFGYSSTCDPTIITGKLPREHDHFSFFAYNPEKSIFKACQPLAYLPRFVTSRGRVRRVLSRYLGRMYGVTGYFQIYNMPFDKLPLFEYTEMRDIYMPGGINSGAPTIFDEFRKNRVPFYLSNWRASEEENLATLMTALNEGAIKTGYLYMAAMDAILHQYGTRTDHAQKKLDWYAHRLREVLDMAWRRYGEVRLFVFSDHGMTNCHTDYPMIPVIESLGLKYGIDYIAVYDSTMARFWFLNVSAERKIRQKLQTIKVGRIVTDQELYAWGCDFKTNRYGDLFFLLDPGVLLCPSYMSEQHLAGMHGYDPNDIDSIASFSSNLFLESTPRRLEELYGLMHREVFGMNHREDNEQPSSEKEEVITE